MLSTYHSMIKIIGGIIVYLILLEVPPILLGVGFTIWKSLMKVGDLVRWTFHARPDFGVVIAVEERWEDAGLSAFVHWFKNPQVSGYWPVSHQ